MNVTFDPFTDVICSCAVNATGDDPLCDLGAREHELRSADDEEDMQLPFAKSQSIDGQNQRTHNVASALRSKLGHSLEILLDDNYEVHIECYSGELR